MKKIWDFEGNGENYIGDFYKIFKEYSIGLNNSQDVIESNIDVRINRNSEAVFTIISEGFNLIEATVKFDGKVNIKVNSLTKIESKSLKIEDVEDYLDMVIKSKEMGSLISHLMRVSKINKNGKWKGSELEI